jgi:hypothetical protein
MDIPHATRAVRIREFDFARAETLEKINLQAYPTNTDILSIPIRLKREGTLAILKSGI